MMEYTRFGELLRIIRVKNHEVMGDMAKAIGTSTSFLSAVETGKKNIPEEWIDVICDVYKLNDELKNELQEAAEVSKSQMKIKLSGIANYKREMALQFQRSFNDIDEITAKKIIKLLNGKESDV